MRTGHVAFESLHILKSAVARNVAAPLLPVQLNLMAKPFSPLIEWVSRPWTTWKCANIWLEILKNMSSTWLSV